MDSALLNPKSTALGFLLTFLTLFLILNPAPLLAQDILDPVGADAYDADPIGDGYWYRSQFTPKWAARAGVLALSRQKPDSTVLFVNPFNAAEDLKASDFDFGYTTGLDVAVMRRFDQWPDVEFRYMGTDTLSAGAGAVTTTAAPLRINTQIPVFLPTGRTIDATYGSDLGSFELNLRSDPQGSHIWLFGIRHVELDEGFHANLIDAVTPTPTVTYDTLTQNRLYGIQVGVETLLGTFRDRLDFDLVAKVGAYHSVGYQRSAIDTGIVMITAAGGAESLSMLAELHLMGNLYLTDNLSMRGGYEVMGVTNVVLATDQVNNTNFVSGTGIDNNGGAFYHGGFLGFDLAY